ncbi:MAG: DNA-binding response regulator [Puniceicoccaceae bacterium]|nr:MAG: DNA-binding response regulator [Puniceicoccaceae bacterium]
MKPSGETILIVEDDPTMLRGLKDNFEFKGYCVRTAADGEAGLLAALEVRPDLIVLDLMLPKMNGYEVCRQLRERGQSMPVIMLTAKSQEDDKLLGLHLGADDYVTKPFSIRELLARVEAFLRRRRQERPPELTFGRFRLDLDSHQLMNGGSEVQLSPKEFNLLRFFLENPHRAHSREAILNAVWGYDVSVTERTVDRFVTTLRTKIEPNPKSPVHLLTVRELGYKFRPEGA